MTGSKAVLYYSDLQALGLGARSTVWEKVRAGKFPQPRDYLGRPAWLREDIEQFLSSLPQRDGVAA